MKYIFLLLLASCPSVSAMEMSARSQQLFSVLWRDAAKKKDKEWLTALKETGTSPNWPNSQGASPLLIAVHEGDLAAVNLLLEFGADASRSYQVSTQDKKELILATSLHHAAAMGHAKIVDRLLEVFSNKALENAHRNCTPLHYAIANGHRECIRLLLGAQPCSMLLYPDLDGNTPLSLAKNHPNPAALEEIKKKLPLHEAAKYNYSAYLRPLVEAGVDVEEKDQDGLTPLDIARIHKSVQALSTLQTIIAEKLLAKVTERNDYYWKQHMDRLRDELE